MKENASESKSQQILSSSIKTKLKGFPFSLIQ